MSIGRIATWDNNLSEPFRQRHSSRARYVCEANDRIQRDDRPRTRQKPEKGFRFSGTFFADAIFAGLMIVSLLLVRRRPNSR